MSLNQWRAREYGRWKKAQGLGYTGDWDQWKAEHPYVEDKPIVAQPLVQPPVDAVSPVVEHPLAKTPFAGIEGVGELTEEEKEEIKANIIARRQRAEEGVRRAIFVEELNKILGSIVEYLTFEEIVIFIPQCAEFVVELRERLESISPDIQKLSNEDLWDFILKSMDFYTQYAVTEGQDEEPDMSEESDETPLTDGVDHSFPMPGAHYGDSVRNDGKEGR